MNSLNQFPRTTSSRVADRDLLRLLHNRVIMSPTQIREWQRLHRLQVPVSLRIVTSPISGDWLVRVDGWEFPQPFPLLYHSLEAAQRAADNVLISDCPHDCRQESCSEWALVPGAGPTVPDRTL
jgi:hypothetical protein